jgi:segregation and condensation protein A
LHLVNQQEVPIENVSMKLVAEQYLEIISRAEQLDLNRLTEYLVIATTLVAIKSQSVIPDHFGEEEPTEEQRDPAFYEELRRRLRQYELTKQRATKLRQTSQLGVDTFQRLDRKATEAFSDEELGPQDGSSLASAFSALLKRIGNTASTFKIRMESISVVSYMMKILDDLQLGGKAIAKAGSFRHLVQRYAGLRSMSKGTVPDNSEIPHVRGVVVGSFIAVLELCRRGVLAAEQDSDSSDILLTLQEGFCVDGLQGQASEKVVPIADYMKSEEGSTESDFRSELRANVRS